MLLCLPTMILNLFILVIVVRNVSAHVVNIEVDSCYKCTMTPPGNGWCDGDYTALHRGDFNGDKICDWLCHSRSIQEPRISILYGTNKCDSYSNQWNAEAGRCQGPTKLLHIIDFNGDGKDDLVCTFQDDINGKDSGNNWVWLAADVGMISDSKLFKADLTNINLNNVEKKYKCIDPTSNH